MTSPQQPKIARPDVDELGVFAMGPWLAQCPCGGGEQTRISYWAVLIPVAAVLLCGWGYDLYSRGKAKSTELPKTVGQYEAEEHREE